VRILLIHQYFLGKDDPGGSRWNQFARYWAANGHRVTVLAGTVHYAVGTKPQRYKGHVIVREREGPGVTVYRCHVSEAYNRSFLGRLWAYLAFTFSSALAGLFCAPRPDVIVATSPPLTVAVTMWLLAAWHGVPAIFEVRDLWPESAIDTGVLTSRSMIRAGYRLEQLAYRRAAGIVALTPAFRDVLVKRKGVRPGRVRVIPNGADDDLMGPGPRDNFVRRRFGLGDKFVVSYFGAHGRANRVGQLLDVAERLKDAHPDVRIVLVGDGMEKPMLVEDARRRGLENVVFLDAVPKRDVVHYINASDVCAAVLMRNETFKTVYPNKVFDYMACARPIVIAIDGAARRLVEEAGAGLFAEPENPEAFVEALLALKRDPERSLRMGESGRRFAVRHYSRRALAERYEGVLKQVVRRDGILSPGRPGAAGPVA